MPKNRYPKVQKNKKGKKLTLSKVNKKLNNLIGTVETKYLESLSTGYSSVSSSGVSSELVVYGITQGTSHSQRVGDKIHLKSIQLRGQMKIGEDPTGATNDSHNQIRLLLIMARLERGAGTPDYNSIFETSTIGHVPEQYINALYKKNPDFTYKVLYDKTFGLYWRNSSGTTGGAPNIVQFNIKRKLNSELKYDSTNQIDGWVPMLIAISDSSVVTHPVMAYNTRVTYTDI